MDITQRYIEKIIEVYHKEYPSLTNKDLMTLAKEAYNAVREAECEMMEEDMLNGGQT